MDTHVEKTSTSATSSTQENTLILTANKRLAIHLRKEYDHSHTSKKTWPSLSVMPISTWTNQVTETLTSKLLLSPAQELALWQKIIVNSPSGSLLPKPYATAKIAAQAWLLLKQWKLPLDCLMNQNQLDTETFYQWAREFEKICAQNQWQDSAENISFLTHCIKNNSCDWLPAQITFVGFQETTPQLEDLFYTLSSQKRCSPPKQCCHPERYCHPERSEGSHEESTTPRSLAMLGMTASLGVTPAPEVTASFGRTALPKLIALENQEQEIKIMAQWAATLLKNTPKARIACVVPELTQLRNQTERLFSNTFSPQKPFNISAGYSLAELAIIRSAFHIFHLNKNDIPIELITQLLSSPFIAGAAEELCARAELCAKLLELNELTLSLQTVIALAREMKTLSVLVNHLVQFQKILNSDKSKRSPKKWAQFFAEQLSSLAWPGQRSLSTQEYQTVKRWEQLLSEFNTLNVIFAELNHHDAILHLQNLAQQTLFQPETTETPIQILGALEVFGLEFDYLWVMGLDDEHFPNHSSPNPFIPNALQRQLHMPHSSAERELDFCKQLIQCYKDSSKNIIFSYATQEKDRIVNPSPLIANYQAISIEDLQLNLINDHKQIIFQSAQLEEYEDSQAPMLSTQEQIHGGTYLFKAQAACPFRAFAQIRLGAQSLCAPATGLNAMERGSLLHEILSNIWHQIKTQENLCQLSQTDLEKIISQAINDSLTHLMKIRPSTLKKRFIEIERKRLIALIIQWLNIEKNRPTFRVVSLEQTHITKFGGIELRMQMDRVDELEDGSHIIIDYKTGNTQVKDWFDERPKEPQLPLYCISSKQVINGILFAQLRPEDMQFKVISANSTEIPGVYPIEEFKEDRTSDTWYELQNYWRTILEKLAQDFTEGHAEVDPKDENTCDYCDLQTLCRIHEHSPI